MPNVEKRLNWRALSCTSLDKPDWVDLVSETKQNSWCVGSWMNFTCNSSAANPSPHNYLLLKNESEVSFSANGKWIEKLSRGGTFFYNCVAYQQLENVTSTNSVTVTVNGKIETWLNISSLLKELNSYRRWIALFLLVSM